MATFKPVVYKDQKRQDKHFDVIIRVTHKRVPKYIPTSHTVSVAQLTKKMEIKDDFIKTDCFNKISEYHKRINQLGNRADNMDCEQIKTFLMSKPQEEQNVIDFFKEALLTIAEKKKRRYREDMTSTLNSFKDFIGFDVYDIKHLNSNVLRGYEKYILTERTMVRPGRNNTTQEITAIAQKNTVIHHMVNIRTMFNDIKRKFNGESEEDTVIKHYPFAKYKIEEKDLTKKRNIKPELIIKVRDMPDTWYTGTHTTNRAALARDMFMLSFYLMGMNSVDLYYAKDFNDGRISYNRAKTENRRADHAFISKKVMPEALPILTKYLDPSGERVFIFHTMYGNEQNFNRAINKGLKKINDLLELGIDLTHYYARHSWATIARNICGISKEDIGEALNHASKEHDVTDIYIEKDWSLLDNMNRKVLDVILQYNQEALKETYEIPDYDEVL